MMSPRRRPSFASRLASVLAFLSLGWIASAQQSAVDAQALIGEWWGGWSGGGVSGQMYLTIEKLKDNKVYGRVEVGGSRLVRDEKFEGTLQGNLLTFSTKAARMELTIEGNQMRGIGYGTMRNEISLMKKK